MIHAPRRALVLLLPLRLLLAAWVAFCALGPAPAAAQALDYGALLKSLSFGEEEEPRPEMSRIPASGLPAASAPAPAPGWSGPVAAPVSPIPGGPPPGDNAIGGALYAGPQALGPQSSPVDPADARAPEVAAYGRIAAAEVEAAANNVIVRTADNVTHFRQRVKRMLRAAPDVPEAASRLLVANAPGGDPRHFLGVLILSVIAVLIGRALVSLYAVFLARPLMIAAQRGPAPVTLGDKLPVLALRFGLTLGAIAICTLAAGGLILSILPDHKPSLATAAIVLGGYAIFLAVDTVWRMTVCPYLPGYRIPRLSDEASRRLYFWLSGATAASLIGQGVENWLEVLGLGGPELALLDAGAGLLSLLAALGMIWANRRAISGAMLGGQSREEASWFAAICAFFWAPAASAYLVLAWFEGVVRTVMGFEQNIPLLAGAFLTLMAGLTIYAVSVFTVEKLFARMRARRMPPSMRAQPVESVVMDGGATDDDGDDGDGDGDDEGGPARAPRVAQIDTMRSELFPQLAVRRHRMRTFEDLAERAAAMFAAGVGFWMLARIWGGGDIFAEGSPLDFLQNIVDKLFIGYVAFHAVRIWLDQRIEDEQADMPEAAGEPGDEGGASSTSRLGTLLPLFRAVILFVIVAATILSLSMQAGVDVTPLFAGAGVVGLAIGFGSQALVRDILSGVFFLLDDAFRKGEYIDVGAVKGTVEKISIRSFQLRHHLGALHTIPFGEIKHLTNFSRDWVMMKLPLRLTYDTDVDKVRKLVKKLGIALLDHPTEGPKFIQPLKSQGVIQMEDSAMIVRVKFMTRPGDQWTTRKLVYQELRNLFEREGIKFAHREVTVRIPDLPEGRPMTPAQREAVSAAAERAVEAQIEEEDRRGGGPDLVGMR